MNRFHSTRAVLISTATTAVLCCNTAAAQEEEKKEGWSGNVTFGYLEASGNADNLNINAGAEVYYDWEYWHHSLKATAFGAQANDEGSAERYTLELKTQRDLGEHDYLFGLIAAENDRFAGVRQQISETVGYGRRLINTDIHILNVEAGVGFRQIEFADTIDTTDPLNPFVVDGEDENDVIIRLGGDYRWNFSDTAHFTQTLAIEIGSENTSSESISAVTANLLGALDLVVSFTIKNNSEVPPDNTSTDRYTAVSLNYAF